MGAWPIDAIGRCTGASVPSVLLAKTTFENLTEATWFHLSVVFVVALYVNFRRPVGLRNLDVIALFAMMPGLLLIDSNARLAFVILFVVTGYWIVRCLLDVTLEGRRGFEANLTGGGLAFLLVALLAYQGAVVFLRPIDPTAKAAADGAKSLLRDKRMPYADAKITLGPGFYWVHVPAVAICDELIEPETAPMSPVPYANPLAAQVMLAVGHLLIVGGLLLLGAKHLGGLSTGLALGVLYLMMPYTLRAAHQSLHVLPCAAIVWALVLSGTPIAAAMVLALGASMAFVPIFLVPVWASFYRKRGAVAFLVTFLALYLVLLASAWIGGGGLDVLWASTFGILEGPDVAAWDLAHVGTGPGFWSVVATPALRIPLLIAYIALCCLLAIWPAEKDLARLVALSGAVILGCQFWIGHGGAQYVLWFLPFLLVLTLRGAVPAKK